MGRKVSALSEKEREEFLQWAEGRGKKRSLERIKDCRKEKRRSLFGRINERAQVDRHVRGRGEQEDVSRRGEERGRVIIGWGE